MNKTHESRLKKIILNLPGALDYKTLPKHCKKEISRSKNQAEVILRELQFPKGKNVSVDQWQSFQNALGVWSDKTFGSKIPDGPLHHLAAEVQEAIEAPDDITEYADCLMLLLDAARIAGFSADDLFLEMVKKFEINKARKWGKPNAQGFTEHVKEELK